MSEYGCTTRSSERKVSVSCETNQLYCSKLTTQLQRKCFKRNLTGSFFFYVWPFPCGNVMYTRASNAESSMENVNFRNAQTVCLKLLRANADNIDTLQRTLSVQSFIYSVHFFFGSFSFLFAARK